MPRRVSNQCSRHWQILATQLRGMQLTYRGSNLNHLQSCVVVDAIFLWLCCMYDLREVCDLLLSLGEIGRWIQTNSRRPVNEIIDDMKVADELLLQQIGDGSFDLARFKHEYRTQAMSGDTISLNYPLLRQFGKMDDESWFGICHQSFAFLTRLTLDSNDPVMIQSAINDFLAVEDRLSADPGDGLRPFFLRYMSNWKIGDDIVPFHSGGAVSDSLNSIGDKYRHVGRDSMTDYLDIRISHTLPFDRPALIRCSKLVCVPKNVSKFRTITMEPCALQYYQHGVGRSIERYINSHPYLRRRINLNDSSINMRYAQSASVMGRWATVDLSSASDSLSYALVKSSLDPLPLRQAATLCRSKVVELPDGTRVPLKKYAGMGSRLTFLFECLFFCAIIECAIEEGGGDPVKSGYRVYGDDIIIETEYVPELKDVLARYDFVMNQVKSYYNTSGRFIFRESCGGEYLNGHDVTPIRLPRNFRGLHVESRRILWQSAAIELANRCYDRLPSVRSHIIHCLNAMPIERRPIFSADGDKGLFSPQPSNYHLLGRLNENYQVRELIHGDTKIPWVRPDRDDDVAYFEWLRRTAGRKQLLYPDDRVEVSTTAIPPARWLTTSSSE